MRVVFFGSPEFAATSLRAVAARHQVALVLAQPDRPAGRGQALHPPAVKRTALELGLPVEQPTKLRDPMLAERLRAIGADAFIVVAYGRILPPALLEIPRLGPYNVHASLLPKYRGAAPIQWALIRGETVTGVCIMRMEEGLDTGPVVARREEPIRDDDTAGTLADRLAVVGAELLLATLPEIEAGRAHAETQDHERATFAPMLEKDTGLLDFSQPAPLVSAQARGVDPWPGATARLADDVIKLFGPKVLEERGAPGEILGLRPQGLAVGCGEGSIAFAELQFPGRKRLPAAAVLAGRAMAPGARLGGRAAETL